MCQGFEHGGLAPVDQWCLHFDPTQVAIVKVPVLILHVTDRPVSDLAAEPERLSVLIGETSQRVDGLSGTLDVDGISLVVVVLRTPVSLEEVVFEELITALEVILKTVVSGAFHVALERIEIVTGVEVVDPTVVGSLAV